MFLDDDPHPLVVRERVCRAFFRKQRFNGDLGCFVAWNSFRASSPLDIM
jgi:hypothetical protein